MLQEEDHPPNSPVVVALEYAPRSLRPRHSFYSLLSLAMAVLVVVWLWYVAFCRPRYHMGGPLWQALWENADWPGRIGIGAAVLGLLQTGRKRTLSIVAIVIILLAYVILSPPMNFA